MLLDVLEVKTGTEELDIWEVINLLVLVVLDTEDVEVVYTPVELALVVELTCDELTCEELTEEYVEDVCELELEL